MASGMPGDPAPGRRGMRLALATLLSPLGLFPALAIHMVAIAVSAGSVDASRAAAGLGAGLLLAGFGLGFGLLGAVVVLLPGAIVLRALGVGSVWTVAALGLAAGLALALGEGGGLAFALYGLSGLGVGLAFGLIAGPALARQRPASRAD